MFCSLPSVIPVKLGLEARCKALEQINEYKSVTDCNYCMNIRVLLIVITACFKECN
jgi:hypothetical protein